MRGFIPCVYNKESWGKVVSGFFAFFCSAILNLSCKLLLLWLIGGCFSSNSRRGRISSCVSPFLVGSLPQSPPRLLIGQNYGTCPYLTLSKWNWLGQFRLIKIYSLWAADCVNFLGNVAWKERVGWIPKSKPGRLGSAKNFLCADKPFSGSYTVVSRSVILLSAGLNLLSSHMSPSL